MIIKHLMDVDEIMSGDCARLRELLNPRIERLQIDFSLAWAKIEPGSNTTPHTLTYSEVYYILKGSGIVHVDDDGALVHAGDAVYIQPHAVQWVENTSAAPLTFLCIVSPAWHPEAEQILDNV